MTDKNKTKTPKTPKTPKPWNWPRAFAVGFVALGQLAFWAVIMQACTGNIW